MAETSKLTHRQLEQSLSQKVIVLYLAQLGHQPHTVSCQLVDKILTIIIEDSITQPEQLLAKSGRQELAKQVRSNINQTLGPHLKSLIEEVVKVPVVDLLSDSAFDTERTSIVAVLASLAQIKQETVSDGDGDG